MRSIGEVPSHEKTGHQNWPASYAECRANVVQMNTCVLDSVSLAGLPDTGEPSHSDIGSHEICSPSCADSSLQTVAEEVAQWTTTNKMALSYDKTKEMRICFKNQPPVAINDRQIEQITALAY